VNNGSYDWGANMDRVFALPLARPLATARRRVRGDVPGARSWNYTWRLSSGVVNIGGHHYRPNPQPPPPKSDGDGPNLMDTMPPLQAVLGKHPDVLKDELQGEIGDWQGCQTQPHSIPLASRKKVQWMMETLLSGRSRGVASVLKNPPDPIFEKTEYSTSPWWQKKLTTFLLRYPVCVKLTLCESHHSEHLNTLLTHPCVAQKMLTNDQNPHNWWNSSHFVKFITKKLITLPGTKKMLTKDLTVSEIQPVSTLHAATEPTGPTDTVGLTQWVCWWTTYRTKEFPPPSSRLHCKLQFL
jgi:hypothetical protein